MTTNTRDTVSEAANDPHYVMPERNHLWEATRFFANFKNSQDGINFIMGVGNNAYTWLNPTEQREFLKNYYEYLQEHFAWAESWVENTARTEAERNLFTTNLNAIRSMIGAAQTEIKSSRENLKRRIRHHYPHPSVSGQPTIDNAILERKIADLSLSEIKQINQSLVKFSNYIKRIHSEEWHGIFDEIADRKKKVETLANILGIAVTDPKINEIFTTLQNNEKVAPEKLLEIIGRISTLSTTQKENLFVTLVPEISLSEYLHIYRLISGKNPPKWEQIITNTLNAMIVRDYPGVTADEKESIREILWQNILNENNNIALTLSSRDFFDGTIPRSPNTDIFLSRLIDDTIGTTDDDKKINTTVKKWNQEYLKDREDIDDEQLLDHENEQAAYGQELLKYNANVTSAATFIAKLSELKIYNSEKLTNVSEHNPLWLVYFSGGRPMYIEIRKIYHATDGKLTVDYVSHLSTQWEYIENTEVESDDARAILHHIDLAENPSQERKQAAGLEKAMSKESKWVILDRVGFEDRRQKGDIDSKKRDDRLTVGELNDRLYELDRLRINIEPGLIIQARSIGDPDRYAYLQIKEIKKNAGVITEIELYTGFNVQGGQNPIKLSTADFISAFSKSHAKRVGNFSTTQEKGAKWVNGLIEIFKNTASQFPNEIKDMVFEPGSDGKGKLTYKKGSISFPTNHIKTSWNPSDYVYIEKISDQNISFYYGKNGNKTTQKKKTKDGETSESNVEFEKVHKFENASLGFFLQFMHSFPGKTWSAEEDQKEKDIKKNLDEQKDKHEEHEHIHYHGGPLQWWAHSKNFGHFFKGMWMAFDKIKHYIEHGDEHTAKYMEYKIMSQMHESKWLKTFMPTEVYLDMKAEIEAENFKAIEWCRDKWSKLSTGNLGSMAVALLEDKYTTNEQMFGLIFALYGKVGWLYGIPVLQNKRDKYGMMFFDKLCVINKISDEEKENVKKMAKSAFKAEETIGEITEEYYIQVLSHRHLQKNINPPPVPGSFHAKLAAALAEGQKKQKESGLNGESNIYATTDQIEERMYMLLADGEIHQAIGFFERLIARGASAQQLMTLPFVLAATDARTHLSTWFIRDSLIEAFYKQWLPFGILNTLTNQEKHNNFRKLLEDLSSGTNRLTWSDGEPILQEEAAKDLRAIFEAKSSKVQNRKWEPTDAKKQKSGDYDTKLKNQTELAKEFWKKHGDTMTRVLNVTDEKSVLLSSENDKVKKYLKDGWDAINGDHFNINADQAKNWVYGDDAASFALIAPKEAVNSFKTNNITGMFAQDDNSEMHKKIFEGFIRAFWRVRNIKNNGARERKFREMHFILLKKFWETLWDQAWNEITKNQPPWYREMKKYTGIDFADARYSRKAINGFIDQDDEKYKILFWEWYKNLMGNGVSSQNSSEKIIQDVRKRIYQQAPAND